MSQYEDQHTSENELDEELIIWEALYKFLAIIHEIDKENQLLLSENDSVQLL